MDKASTRSLIESIYAARIAGDTAALKTFLAPNATYEMVGAQAFADPRIFGPTDAAAAAHHLVNDFRFHTVTTIDAVIDDHQAAIFIRLEVSFRGGPPILTEACDLWQFDTNGKVTSLKQFVDTDQLRRLIAAGP